MSLTPGSQRRVLLLQIRNEASVREEEYRSFLKYSGLHADQLDTLNAFATPIFGPEVLTGYDALFVGGASEASVLEPGSYPFVASGIALLKYCATTSLPVFASCFGFQLAILALGGTIVRDTKHYEMGTPLISLTPAAANDVLFRDFPNEFPAVSVHMERATDVPKQCELLAVSPACPHAFKLKTKPFWAFQFHPEVDKATLVERLTTYRQKYTGNDLHLAAVLRNAVETPHSNGLLRKFVNQLLC